jgi:myo-inositol 2-dehydrogenase/D-chiro-inositol 1-dehydrogenase
MTLQVPVIRTRRPTVPVRIGFIGTGGIAGAHFNTLSQIEDAQPVAFCDVATDKAEAAARRFEGQAYSNPRKMLEAETLDAVYVCLPPHAHKDAEILAAQRGCALFVEKPLSNSMRTAERIAAAIQDAGVTASVGYHWRYMGSTERVQKLLTAKNAPQVSMAYGRWLGGFPGVPWWRRMNQSGGQLVEQCTHIVDLARYLIGDIKKVYCCSALREMNKVYEGTTVPDVTALTIEFESGAIGYVATSCLLGSVGDVGLSLMLRDTIYDLHGNSLTVRQGAETHTYEHKNSAMLDEDRAFIKAVKTGKKLGIKSTYVDALKTLAVTLAANQSAKTGKPVKL